MEKYENIEVNSERWFDLKPLLNEEWRDIKGYENLYQVSNYGRIKTLKYYDGIKKHQKTKILKQCLNLNGYYIVNLSNKNSRVHRIVAKTFLENNGYNCVNHINGNKKNNRVDNLEWCSSSHNNKEAYRLNLRKAPLKNKYGKNYPKKVHIIGMYKNGELIEKFYGGGEIKRKYNYNPSAILETCKGKLKKMYGYEWKFLNE